MSSTFGVLVLLGGADCGGGGRGAWRWGAVWRGDWSCRRGGGWCGWGGAWGGVRHLLQQRGGGRHGERWQGGQVGAWVEEGGGERGGVLGRGDRGSQLVGERSL